MSTAILRRPAPERTADLLDGDSCPLCGATVRAPLHLCNVTRCHVMVQPAAGAVLTLCPGCRGDGRVWIEMRPVWGGDLRDANVQCEACGGSGLAEVAS